MKLVPILLVAGLLALIPLAVTGQPARQALYAAEDRTVIVYGDTLTVYPDGSTEIDYNQPYCSGFVWRSERATEDILTARHCASTTMAMTLFGPISETTTPSRVQFFNGDVGRVVDFTLAPHDDVSELHVQSKRSHPAVALGKPIYRGEDLFGFGMPDGLDWSYTPAVSTQGSEYSNSDAPWKYTYLVSCPSCGPGSSGGGVWSNDGKLVGMTVAGGDSADMLIVPIERLTAAFGEPK